MSELKQLIVGSGIGGMTTAYAFEKAGLPYILYTASDVIGGVWNDKDKEFGLVNESSTTQLDHIVFGDMDEDRTVTDHKDLLMNLRSSAASVVADLENIHKKVKGAFVFNRRVTSWNYDESSKIVTVHSEDTKTGVKFEEKFAGLHLHTGSLNLCNMRKTQFPNESAFKGKIAYGVRNDVSLKEMEGKDVVVIGWGAFSVDAIKRALVGGAKSIAVLYRTPRVHWFDYNTYLLDHEFFNPGAGNPAHVAATWESHFDAHRKGAAATSCSSLLDNSDLVRKVDGKDNMILSSSPTTSFDLVALGIHYGLVKPIRDTVKAFTSSGVSTDSGKEYHADIVFKCIGFDAETSLIKGHVLTDAWWIDGHPNLTSAINIDKVQGTYLVGPSSPGRDVFIMSYFTFHQISLIMAHYIKNPDKFEEYKKLPLFSTIVPSEYSNLMNIGPMISKVFASGQEVPIGIMVQCFLRTQELYGKHLPPGEFYRLDKAKWERMVDFFVAKTAKPKVEYPFPAFSF